MCETCGCSDDARTTIHHRDGSHTHVFSGGRAVTHVHRQERHHAGGTGANAGSTGVNAGHGVIVPVNAAVLAKNRALAERNRRWLREHGVTALNLMSSPGSGKTTLLERTLRELELAAAVVEGDQETERDAERLRATGVPTVQINTATGCHLEADMIWHALPVLEMSDRSVLFIENVGNLVCPALFDLGEDCRVVLFSVTEGEDKPLKYPHMFRSADLVLLTKVDLLPFIGFDTDQAEAAVHSVRPELPVLHVSATTGAGLDAWYEFVRQRQRPPGAAASSATAE